MTFQRGLSGMKIGSSVQLASPTMQIPCSDVISMQIARSLLSQRQHARRRGHEAPPVNTIKRTLSCSESLRREAIPMRIRTVLDGVLDPTAIELIECSLGHLPSQRQLPATAHLFRN